ncbi:MAG: substrate-binding domain-containing protein [Planctomycetes bacterium]|nr:substrate-binding domain-containing protein [Planctomycetota bacterium]
MAKTFQVALYLNMTLLHQQGMVHGVIRYSRERRNWNLFGAYWPMYEINDINKWGGDGIIAAVESREDIEMLTRPGLPVVDTSGAIYHPQLSTITNDNVGIGVIGGEHMADNGFEHYAFCAADGSAWSDERLEGFRRATSGSRERGVAVFSKKIGWWHSPEFSRELAEFLQLQPKPLAVMSANDIIGMNVVGACRLAGLRIPEDVALVSVDNEELLCDLSTPPISSIPFDREEIGYRSAERLDMLMQGVAGETPPPLRIRPLPLVERASSAMFAVSDPMVAQALALIRSDAIKHLGAGEVAAKLYTSRRNLERKFRQQMGRTLLEEIHRTRIKHAKRLLRESKLSATRIAYLSGFGTLDRFAAVFSRYAGVAPKQYRDDHNLAPDRESHAQPVVPSGVEP